MGPGTDLEGIALAVEPGGKLLGVRELIGGVSATVILLEIETPSRSVRRVVVRQHPVRAFKERSADVTIKEFELLRALHHRGMPVPAPLLLFEGDDHADPFLVVDYIDGSSVVDDGALFSALVQMAEFLAVLHNVDAEWMPVRGLAPMEAPWPAVLGYLPDDAEGQRLRGALDTAPPELRPNDPVIIHGDYWPGNVMWHDGRLQAVIDWEDAALGDPLADLAAARVELLCQFGGDAPEVFTTRYLDASNAGTPIRVDDLAVWELYVSSAALATMHDWQLDPDEEARRRRLTRGFFDAAARRLLASG